MFLSPAEYPAKSSIPLRLVMARYTRNHCRMEASRLASAAPKPGHTNNTQQHTVLCTFQQCTLQTEELAWL